MVAHLVNRAGDGHALPSKLQNVLCVVRRGLTAPDDTLPQCHAHVGFIWAMTLTKVGISAAARDAGAVYAEGKAVGGRFLAVRIWACSWR